MTPQKSTVDQIRQRFDNDVERFSNLETGQVATIDSPLGMELITQAAAAVTPGAKRVLDIGCGAGNYCVKLLGRLPGLDVTLIDLSRPMLDRAVERTLGAGAKTATAMQVDIREAALEAEGFDIVLAASTLHHLRSDAEWHSVFSKVYHALRPGGSFWIFDMLQHDDPAIHNLMWSRYGDYLVSVGGEAYRDKVFAYIDQEDTPRSMMFQIDTLRAAGFAKIEILHKNSSFGAFGGIKG